jgi:hypothetical protein
MRSLTVNASDAMAYVATGFMSPSYLRCISSTR